jgi:hypothetical protein
MKCDHPKDKRKSEASYKMPNGNLLFISCAQCGMKRNESRNNDGSITTSDWFVENKQNKK